MKTDVPIRPTRIKKFEEYSNNSNPDKKEKGTILPQSSGRCNVRCGEKLVGPQ